MWATQLHLFPDGGAFPGVDRTLARDDRVDRDAIVNLEWHSDGSYTLLYRFAGGDREHLATTLDDNETVRRYELVDGRRDRLYAFVHVDEQPELSALLRIAEEHALLLEPPFHFTDDGVRVTLAGEEGGLRDAFDDATDTIPLTVEWTGGYAPEEPDALGRLTDRQREALTVAHELGYYETPRAVSFDEVADELDCAPSTANELLRRAEGTLVDAVLER